MTSQVISKNEKDFLTSKGYRIFKIICVGADAKIYLSSYEKPETHERSYLVCKVYDTKKIQKKFGEKFLPREIGILINLKHPCLIQIHSLFKWKTKYFIFMRYAERGDLFDYLQQNGCLNEQQARKWCKQLSLALKYLHDLDIVHRDLKCENVLITRNYNAKLADFGFCRSAVNELGQIIMSETYCGSLSYAAPEVLIGEPYICKPADVWSLGIVLYIMVNRAMPFYEKNIIKLHHQQMQRKWKFRSNVEGTLSNSIKILINNLLNPNPEVRSTINEILCSEWMLEETNLDNTQEGETEVFLETRTIYDGLRMCELEKINRDIKRTITEVIKYKDVEDLRISDPILVENEPQEPQIPKEKKRCCII